MTGLLLVLLAALVFSQIFQRFNLPWVIALMAGGLVIGVSGFQWVEIDVTLEFLAQLGVVFLMFMAGLETKLSGLKEVWKDSLSIAFLTGTFPMAAGMGVAWYFGYDMAAVLLIGIVFVSSSVAVVIPTLEAQGMLPSNIGKVIVSSIMFQDVASLILLAGILQYLDPGSGLPFPVFVGLFLLALVAGFVLQKMISKLRWALDLEDRTRPDFFERELRFVFITLISVVVALEVLGIHPIAGAFFAGLILVDAISSGTLKGKIHALAYGLFIPIFFVVRGIQTDLTVLLDVQGATLFLFLILVSSMLSKFGSGWIASRILGYTNIQSSLVGSACIPQLSTSLAVVSVGEAMGFLDPEVVTAMVLLSMVTAFVSPVLMGIMIDKVKETYFVDNEAGAV